MKISTLKALSITFCCLISSLWSETQCAEDDKYPPEFLCPITTEVMIDPVVAGDGFSYERIPITEWLEKNKTSPMTRSILDISHIIPNNNLRQLISEWENIEKAAELRTQQQVKEAIERTREETKQEIEQQVAAAIATAIETANENTKKQVSTAIKKTKKKAKMETQQQVAAAIAAANANTQQQLAAAIAAANANTKRQVAAAIKRTREEESICNKISSLFCFCQPSEIELSELGIQ